MMPHEILEELSRRGYAPTLIYDDDGHWLVVDCGIAPLGVRHGNFTVFVGEDVWSKDISSAVENYKKKTGEIF